MILVRRKLREISNRYRSKRSYDRATLDDLYYCYRLFLKRDPDPDGWAHFKKEILNNQYNLAHLVDIFLKGSEFLNQQERAAQPILIELEGFNIYVRRNDFFIGAVIEGERKYEPHVGDELRNHLKEGDVFVDIGANIGYFTLMGASLVGTHGYVHAFEPHPNNCKFMQMSLEVNSFKNVTVYPYAVAESQQNFQLEVAGSSSNARIVDFSPTTVSDVSLTHLVEAITLDEILTEVDRIDVIKMDIEGAEPRAWRGMAKIVREFCPVIFFEFSPNAIKLTSHVEPSDFLEEVISSGYELFVIDRQGGRKADSQTPEQIIQYRRRLGATHFDLIAVPQE